MARRSIVWESYEYYFRPKTRDWYWIVWIVTIAAAGISAIFHNTLFAALLIIGMFALTLFAERPPRVMRYEVSERGVIVGKTLYPYSALKSFGIDVHTETMPKLVLKSKKVFLPYIIILLVGTNEEEIREYLSGYLPDAENSEPLTHKIMEYLGF